MVMVVIGKRCFKPGDKFLTIVGEAALLLGNNLRLVGSICKSLNIAILRRVTHTSIQVVYGIPEQVKQTLGAHTAYVERTHLTSRQMNARLVRKTLLYSKQLELLEAACAWEDWLYNLTRPIKTLRVEFNDGQRRWQPRSPAMAPG